MSNNSFRVNRGLSLNPQTSIPSSPTNGDIYYDANMGTYVFYDGGSWINLASQTDIAGASTINSTSLTAAIVQNPLVRITGSTAASLYGLTASTGGKSIVIYNDSSQNITIFNQNAGEPTASNRITTPNGTPIILVPEQAISLMYDASQASWIITSSGGGSNSGGTAQEVSIPSGSTSLNVIFPLPQNTSSYSVLSQIVNTTDIHPEYIPVTITAKSTTGFTAQWNTPIPNSNYLLDYAVAPGLSIQGGEIVIPISSTSITISIPIAFTNTSYVAIAEMVNFTDASVQFQPVTVTNKTNSTFTISWNAPTSTANYRLSWNVGTYQ